MTQVRSIDDYIETVIFNDLGKINRRLHRNSNI